MLLIRSVNQKSSFFFHLACPRTPACPILPNFVEKKGHFCCDLHKNKSEFLYVTPEYFSCIAFSIRHCFSFLLCQLSSLFPRDTRKRKKKPPPFFPTSCKLICNRLKTEYNTGIEYHWTSTEKWSIKYFFPSFSSQSKVCRDDQSYFERETGEKIRRKRAYFAIKIRKISTKHLPVARLRRFQLYEKWRKLEEKIASKFCKVIADVQNIKFASNWFSCKLITFFLAFVFTICKSHVNGPQNEISCSQWRI